MAGGEFAAMLCPPWMHGIIAGEAPDVTGWDVADAFPEGGGNWGGSYLVVPANGANVEAAQLLADWLTAPETQIKAFNNAGTFPSQPEAQSSADLTGFVNDYFNGAPTGEISLYYQEPPTAQAMIGYSMLPAFRGRGLTTRAAQLLALWAFAETGVARLIAGTFPDNLGSQRVLTKAGFRREAYLRSRLPGGAGTRHDDVQFVLLAEDLLAQASGGELTQPG
jgi:RimJ/RimL family protein N-acetyltransferase